MLSYFIVSNDSCINAGTSFRINKMDVSQNYSVA
jgi:hypothetical protein